MEIVECSSVPRTHGSVFLRCALAGFVLLANAPGCTWWLRITEVNGTVRVDGKPASGVQLVFEPLAKDRPRAFARTNQDGFYKLGRQGPGNNSGAAAGKYRVQVMSDTEREDPVVIPPEYNVKSTLEFEVVPGKTNVFDIDIVSKEKPGG